MQKGIETSDMRLSKAKKEVWSKRKPVLDDSEMGRETDTGRIKFGDGRSTWDQLPYFEGGVTAPSNPTLVPDVDGLYPIGA